jgi:Rod binding domain-containing protein
MDTGTKIDSLTAPGRKTSAGGAEKGQSMGKAAEAFESFLIQTMLKELDKATHITKRGFAEETQMSIFYEKVGEFMAKKGIGIKDMLMKYIERGAKVSPKKGENSKLGGVA